MKLAGRFVDTRNTRFAPATQRFEATRDIAGGLAYPNQYGKFSMRPVGVRLTLVAEWLKGRTRLGVGDSV